MHSTKMRQATCVVGCYITGALTECSVNWPSVRHSVVSIVMDWWWQLWKVLETQDKESPVQGCIKFLAFKYCFTLLWKIRYPYTQVSAKQNYMPVRYKGLQCSRGDRRYRSAWIRMSGGIWDTGKAALQLAIYLHMHPTNIYWMPTFDRHFLKSKEYRLE